MGKNVLRQLKQILAPKKKWPILFIVALIVLLTNVTLTSLKRFEVVDFQLLVDPLFSEWRKHWRLKGNTEVRVSPSQVDLVNTFGDSGQLVQQIEIDTPGFVRLTIEAGGESISVGHQSWAGGAVAFVYYDANGKSLKQSAFIRVLADSSIKKYEYIEYINKPVAMIEVSIRLLRASGTFSIRNPVLTRLKETSIYRIAKVVIAAGWILIGCYLVYLGFVLLGFTQVVFFSGLGAVVLIFVLAPPEFIASTKQNLSVFLMQISNSVTENMSGGAFQSLIGDLDLSGVGHFVAFFVLGMILGCFFGLQNAAYGFCCLFVFAFATEVLQTYVDGRSTSLEDVYIDVFGALTGVLAGLVILFIFRFGCLIIGCLKKRISVE